MSASPLCRSTAAWIIPSAINGYQDDITLTGSCGKLVILPTHDSVDRHFSFYNYFPHIGVDPQVRLSTIGGNSVLYKNDNCFWRCMILAGVSPMKRLRDRVR
jgi:hypothetical protein